MRRGILSSLVNDVRRILQREMHALVMQEVQEVQREMEGGPAIAAASAGAAPAATRRSELKVIASRIERYLMGSLARFHA